MIKKLGKHAFILSLLWGGCSADFQSKHWAQNELKGQPPSTMIQGLVDVGFIENRGMVFGILNNQGNETMQNVLLGFRIAILAGIAAFLVIKRRSSISFLLPFLLILAGAGGNVLDRIFYGFVVDFIHLRLGTLCDWPFYFNLSDVYLCAGLTLVVVKSILFHRPKSI